MKNVHKYGYLAVILFLTVLGYAFTQKQTSNLHNLETNIDTKIPFESIFVIFYIAYYPFVTIILFLYWNDEKNFKAMSSSIILIAAVSLVIYQLFQTKTDRPSLHPTTMCDSLVYYLYSLDDPVNGFPSLHVSLTTISTIFVYEQSKHLFKFVLPIAILIIISTLFIKQHYVIDVMGGIFLAFAAFRCTKVLE
jgi:membrane-associated phospholipid phosphatase